MAAESSIRPGDLIPGFRLTAVGGEGRIGPWDYKQRQSLVLVFLHDGRCADCSRFVAVLSEIYTEIRRASAAALVVVESAGFEEKPPFPVLLDPGGDTRRAYEVDGVDLLLVDRYNALFHRWEAPDADALPTTGELGEWLEFLEIQCEECHPPEPWGDG